MSGKTHHAASSSSYIDLTEEDAVDSCDHPRAAVVAAFDRFLQWVADERPDEELGDVMAELLVADSGPRAWHLLLDVVPSSLGRRPDEMLATPAPPERPAILRSIDVFVAEAGLALPVSESGLVEADAQPGGVTIGHVTAPQGPYQLVDGWLIHHEFNPERTEETVQRLLESATFGSVEAQEALAEVGIGTASVDALLSAHPDVMYAGCRMWCRRP